LTAGGGGIFLIEIQNLKKVWSDGKVVLDDINLTIEDGDIYALVGRSGAGKSTLLRCINGLASYNDGHILLDGKEVKELSYKEMRDVRCHVGMVLQNFSLLERRTVYENVALPLVYAGVPKAEREKAAVEALTKVGLGERVNFKPNQLSGGQKQRVAIARALINHPRILLADEPTGALDQKSGKQVMELFEELNKEGVTIVMITHDAHVASKAKRVIHIIDGMIQEGTHE